MVAESCGGLDELNPLAREVLHLAVVAGLKGRALGFSDEDSAMAKVLHLSSDFDFFMVDKSLINFS